MPKCPMCKCDVDGLIPIPEVSQKTNMYLSLKGIKSQDLICIDCWEELIRGSDWTEQLICSMGELLHQLTLVSKALEKDNEIQDEVIKDYGEKMENLDTELEIIEKSNDKAGSTLKELESDINSLNLDVERKKSLNTLVSDAMWELGESSYHISSAKDL